MTKKTDLTAALEALKVADAEVISELEAQIDELFDAAKAATVETAAYADKLQKVRAHCQAMKQQLGK